MGSRITPPIPVLAPPKGSSAQGWLWVSTLKQTLYSSSNLIIPELSLNTDTHQGLSSSLVTRIMVDFSRLFIFLVRRTTPACRQGRDDPAAGRTSGRRTTSVYSIFPRNVLCRQCSLQVWAMVSSSQSVGFRLRPLKCFWIVFISARFKNSCPFLLISKSFLSLAFKI